MNNLNTATIRTTVNAFVASAVVWLIGELTGTQLDVTNPLIIAVGGVAVGVVYRASREAADRWPVLGRVLFGVNTPPTYTTGD